MGCKIRENKKVQTLHVDASHSQIEPEDIDTGCSPLSLGQSVSVSFQSKTADDTQHINLLCRQMMPVLRRVVYRYANRLPKHIQMDDLMGAGAVGMLTVVRRYADLSIKELTRVVEHRVRGAMLDYLRSQDHLKRRQRLAVNMIEKARRKLCSQGEEPELEDIARYLGMRLEHAEKAYHHLSAVSVMSMELMGDLRDSQESPAQITAQRQMIALMQKLCLGMPERVQMLLRLHYQSDMSYKDIGVVLNLSRTRVCQLHREAISELRKLLVNRR